MNSNEQQSLLEELKRLYPHFNSTLQDLRTPTEDFVTNFYTYWLSEFEVNIASIPQTQFSQQIRNVTAYNDSYSSTIPKINLLCAIRAFNVVPDFGMLDIVSPTPRRTQTVIRVLCEFYDWCDSRICSMIDMKKMKKVSERKQRLANLLREKQNLQEQLNNVFITIGQLQDSKKELEGELMKYQQMASGLRLEKEVLKTLSDEAMEKIRDKEAIRNKIVKEDSQVTNKIKDYSNQFVNSPTMVLNDLETLRIKDKEMKNSSEQRRDMVESKMKAQKIMEEVLSSLEKKSGQLDEVLTLIEHQRKLLQVVSDVEKNTTSCHEGLKELKSSLMTIMKKKSTCQEELQAINLKWKTMKDQLTQSLEAAKSEWRDQKNAKSKMIDSLKENATVEEKIISVTENIKAYVNAFEEEYQKILNQENAFFERTRSEGISQMEKINKEVKRRSRRKSKK